MLLLFTASLWHLCVTCLVLTSNHNLDVVKRLLTNSLLTSHSSLALPEEQCWSPWWRIWKPSSRPRALCPWLSPAEACRISAPHPSGSSGSSTGQVPSRLSGTSEHERQVSLWLALYNCIICNYNGSSTVLQYQESLLYLFAVLLIVVSSAVVISLNCSGYNSSFC